MKRSSACFAVVLMLLVAAGTTMAKTVVVRVDARNYQELYDHVTFKGTSIDIAGALTTNASCALF